MERRPGTPSLLRELNDRAALDLLLPGTPLTRTQISERTRVSKVTVAQMLARLEERGLVTVVGQQEGGRGPNAALYSVVPASAYVAGLYVELDGVSAGVADVTGRVVAEVSVNPNGAANPVELVRGAVDRACRTAGVEMSRLSAFVIGSPGVVDPKTGDPRLAINLPDWHEGVLGALRGALNRPVIIENDVNLAALAERSVGAARGLEDFVLVWIGGGLGMAAFLGGRVHRGTAGAAGEIGYLPVPGAPLQEDVRHPADGGLQSLVGASVVRMLAGVFGFGAPTAGESVRAAVRAAGERRGQRQRVPEREQGVAACPAPPPAPRSSSVNWAAVSRSASPRCPSSSTPAWSSSAATSAWRAAPPSPTGSRPRSPASARPAPASCPPRSPARRCCAAPCSPPSTRPAPTSSTPSRRPSRRTRDNPAAETDLPRAVRPPVPPSHHSLVTDVSLR